MVERCPGVAWQPSLLTPSPKKEEFASAPGFPEASSLTTEAQMQGPHWGLEMERLCLTEAPQGPSAGHWLTHTVVGQPVPVPRPNERTALTGVS